MLLWRYMKLMSSSFCFSCQSQVGLKHKSEEQIASASWKDYTSKKDKRKTEHRLTFWTHLKVEIVLF